VGNVEFCVNTVPIGKLPIELISWNVIPVAVEEFIELVTYTTGYPAKLEGVVPVYTYLETKLEALGGAVMLESHPNFILKLVSSPGNVTAVVVSYNVSTREVVDILSTY
jgi:hypothetical protein